MPLQQCNGAASEEESRLLSDDELRDLPPFAKEEITEAREILHLYVGGEEKGLKNRALSYFAGSKKKVGRTDFLRVKELLETRRPTAQQSRVASGALSRDDLFAWVKSLILREIKAVEILTRLVEGKTEGLADMATAYLQDAAGEYPSHSIRRLRNYSKQPGPKLKRDQVDIHCSRNKNEQNSNAWKGDTNGGKGFERRRQAGKSAG